MSKLDNIIFCILGKSGSGKTTLANALADKYSLNVLKSYTTRPKRTGSDNTDHVYITKEEYDALPNKVAYTKFDNNYYCATKDQVDNCQLYVIDPYGIGQLKTLYDGSKQIVTIYIDVDSIICVDRMKKRGDDDLCCYNRLVNDSIAFQGVEQICDYIIDGNSDLNYMIEQAEEIMDGYIDPPAKN